jgi:hypothetical protein
MSITVILSFSLFVVLTGTDLNLFCINCTLGQHIKKDWGFICVRLRLKCDGTRAETRFCLSAKGMSTFKLAGASVQSTTGSRRVCIGGSNAGYTKFQGSVKGTGYPLHSPVSPSLPRPCITMCHHVSMELYLHCSQWQSCF